MSAATVREQVQQELQNYVTDTIKHMVAVKSFLSISDEHLKTMQDIEKEVDLIRRNEPKTLGGACKTWLCGFVPCAVKEDEELRRTCVCCCGTCYRDGGRRQCVGCTVNCGDCCKCCCLSWDSSCIFCNCCYTDESAQKCVCCCIPRTTREKETSKKRLNKLNAALNKLRTLMGKLQSPLQAIERLALTSERVLEDPLIQMFVEVKNMCRVLSVIKDVSPNVIVFKDADVFTTALIDQPGPAEEHEPPRSVSERTHLLSHAGPEPPSEKPQHFQTLLENIKPLHLKVQTFICALKNICYPLNNSGLMDLRLDRCKVHVPENLSEAQAVRTLLFVQKLQKIRDEEDFHPLQMVNVEKFTDEPREQMNSCVGELTLCAEGLKTMECWRLCLVLISSFLAIIGGALYISGLVQFYTVTYESTLLMCGALCTGISGLISLITMIVNILKKTELMIKVNNISEKFSRHMKDFSLHLNNSIFSLTETIPDEDKTMAGFFIGSKAVCLWRLGDMTFNLIIEFIAEQKIEKTQSTLSHILGICTNSFFLIGDVVSFVVSIYNLCKKKPTMASRWLRARARLWKEEVQTWAQVSERLRQGQPKAQRNREVLNSALYGRPSRHMSM